MNLHQFLGEPSHNSNPSPEPGGSQGPSPGGRCHPGSGPLPFRWKRPTALDRGTTPDLARFSARREGRPGSAGNPRSSRSAIPGRPGRRDPRVGRAMEGRPRDRRRSPVSGGGLSLRARAYWMDEAALVSNIRELTPAGFFGPLMSQQLAPPGFLVAVLGLGASLRRQRICHEAGPAPGRDRRVVPVPRGGPAVPAAPGGISGRRDVRGLERPDLLRLGGETIRHRRRLGPGVPAAGPDGRPGR